MCTQRVHVRLTWLPLATKELPSTLLQRSHVELSGSGNYAVVGLHQLRSTRLYTRHLQIKERQLGYFVLQR